jgi:hypothetical protein
MKINQRIVEFLVCLVVVGVLSYFSYDAGINRAIGRTAYVNATFVRLEEKCIASNDVECLKMYWRMRAAAAAESARRSNSGIGPNSVEHELDEYISWADKLPIPTSVKN